MTRGKILYDSQKVEWRLQGPEGREDACCCLIGLEFQFRKMKSVLDVNSGGKMAHECT